MLKRLGIVEDFYFDLDDEGAGEDCISSASIPVYRLEKNPPLWYRSASKLISREGFKIVRFVDIRSILTRKGRLQYPQDKGDNVNQYHQDGGMNFYAVCSSYAGTYFKRRNGEILKSRDNELVLFDISCYHRACLPDRFGVRCFARFALERRK